MDKINWICYYTKNQTSLVDFVKSSWPENTQEIVVDSLSEPDKAGDTLSNSFNKVVSTKWKHLSDIIINAPMDSAYGFMDVDIWFFSDPSKLLYKALDKAPLLIQTNMPNMTKDFRQWFDSSPTCNIGFMVIKVTEITKSFFLAFKEALNLWEAGTIYCEKPVDQHIFNKLLEKGFCKNFALLDVNLFASKSNCLAVQDNTFIFHATNCKGITHKIEILKKAIQLQKECSANSVASMHIEDEDPKFRRN